MYSLYVIYVFRCICFVIILHGCIHLQWRTELFIVCTYYVASVWITFVLENSVLGYRIYSAAWRHLILYCCGCGISEIADLLIFYKFTENGVKASLTALALESLVRWQGTQEHRVAQVLGKSLDGRCWYASAMQDDRTGNTGRRTVARGECRKAGADTSAGWAQDEVKSQMVQVSN